MLDKLEAIKARFEDLGVSLTNPAIIGDNRKFGQLSKEYRSLEKIVNAYMAYKKSLDDVAFYREALNGSDEEMRELAKSELPQAEEHQAFMEKEIRQMLIPKDPRTTRMPSWRSGQEPVGMKPVCLRETWCACTCAIVSGAAGKQPCSARTKEPWVGIRKCR